MTPKLPITPRQLYDELMRTNKKLKHLEYEIIELINYLGRAEELNKTQVSHLITGLQHPLSITETAPSPSIDTVERWEALMRAGIHDGLEGDDSTEASLWGAIHALTPEERQSIIIG